MIRLPADKLRALQELLDTWHSKKNCIKKDSQSIVGLLNNACKAVRSGRSFLRWLIDLTYVRREGDDKVCLNVEARSDIEWWHQFAQSWNGVSMLPALKSQLPKGVITADVVSGNWGCGALSDNEWFQLPWGGSLSHSLITVKELTPIVMAVAVWGAKWKGCMILLRSDNMATVNIINSRTSHNGEAMHLMRCLAFIQARWQVSVAAKHIPGVHNTLADALSRNKLVTFHSLFPQANSQPTPIPEALIDLLVISRPD